MISTPLHNPTNRRCDCENDSCHPKADCQSTAEFRTTHSMVCRTCAEKMPAKYMIDIPEVKRTPLNVCACCCDDCEQGKHCYTPNVCFDPEVKS